MNILPEEKRLKLIELLKDKSRNDFSIAKEVGVHHSTVVCYRTGKKRKQWKPKPIKKYNLKICECDSCSKNFIFIQFANK